jgi:hypothetical protein
MKKRLLFVAAIVAASTTFAQDGLTSKKGEAYLPEAGDWAIGFDATNLTEYIGNLANGGNNNGGLDAAWMDNHKANNAYEFALMGKKFKDESTAYRLRARIGFGSTKQDNIFEATVAPATLPSEYTDSDKSSSMNIILGGGIEKRRGNTRVQGFYGAEAMIGFGTSTDKKEYGIGLSDNYTNGGNTRQTEDKKGTSIMFGARGFVGVEYFFAPKMSIAAEYGWGLSFMSQGEGEITTEKWGLAPGEAVTTADHLVTKTTKSGGNSEFKFDTDNMGGSINLLFHF